MNICRLDVVLYKRNAVLFAVCPFYFSSVKCYLVLFLYSPIDSPLFVEPLCCSKEVVSVCPAAVMLCKVMCKRTRMYIMLDCTELLFIACLTYKLDKLASLSVSETVSLRPRRITSSLEK